MMIYGTHPFCGGKWRQNFYLMTPAPAACRCAWGFTFYFPFFLSFLTYCLNWMYFFWMGGRGRGEDAFYFQSHVRAAALPALLSCQSIPTCFVFLCIHVVSPVRILFPIYGKLDYATFLFVPGKHSLDVTAWPEKLGLLLSEGIWLF